jgi:hypothetical protein
MARQERRKSSVSYVPLRTVTRVNRDNNKFKVTVRGSGNGKRLEDILTEMSALILEISEKATKKYTV